MSNLDTGNVLGIFAFLVSIGGVIYTAINHKRFRLKCCGKDIDVSVDVEDTTKKPGESVDTTKSGERPVATAPILATPTKQTIQVSQKQNDEDEDEEEDEEEEYVDRRKQNIRENERNEALKAQYALRVANARKYNQNRRVAPLPPLLPP